MTCRDSDGRRADVPILQSRDSATQSIPGKDEVKLGRAFYIALSAGIRAYHPGDTFGKRERTAWDYLRAQYEAQGWWGQWQLGVTNVTNCIDSTFTIGSSVPPERKLWVYFQQHLRLDFIESSTWTDGTTDLEIAMTLSGAWMDFKGIYPSRGAYSMKWGKQWGPDEDGSGVGEVNRGVFSHLFRPGRVSWHRE